MGLRRLSHDHGGPTADLPELRRKTLRLSPGPEPEKPPFHPISCVLFAHFASVNAANSRYLRRPDGPGSLEAISSAWGPMGETPICGEPALYPLSLYSGGGLGWGVLAFRHNRTLHPGPIRKGEMASNFVESLEARWLLSTGFLPPQTLAAGSDPRSVAVADVNGDGKPDLIVANYLSSTLSVMLGNGNGTFQPQETLAAGKNAISVTAADLTGD